MAEKMNEIKLEDVRFTVNGIDNEIEELKVRRQLEKFREEQRKGATQMRIAYEAYVEAGFTEEQAWEIIRLAFSK